MGPANSRTIFSMTAISLSPNQPAIEPAAAAPFGFGFVDAYTERTSEKRPNEFLKILIECDT
jgi:hypothetical protein